MPETQLDSNNFDSMGNTIKINGFQQILFRILPLKEENQIKVSNTDSLSALDLQNEKPGSMRLRTRMKNKKKSLDNIFIEAFLFS
jgi:hypothetical protein